MKKLAAFLLLAVSVSCFATPYAEARTQGNPQLRKGEKKQQRAIKKYAKAQRNAQRRMLKLDQKNNKRLAKHPQV